MSQLVAFVICCLVAIVNAQPLISQKKSNALPSNLINELVYKCKDLKSLLNTCDMCSLCQNGAMCQQKPKSTQIQQYNNNNMYPFGYNNMYNQMQNNNQVTFDLLKSLIDFKCYCVPGHTGTYCQINVDECLSHPCSNNSTCIDGLNRYECKCPAGYTGKPNFF